MVTKESSHDKVGREATPQELLDFCLTRLHHPKSRQLIEAAGTLFMKLPYDSVSTDAIAKDAKVSKATLYAYFSSKEVLFAAFVCWKCSKIADHIWGDLTSTGGLASDLRQIAHGFTDMLTSPETIALYRSIVAQSIRFPELGRVFYESGPRRIQTRLAALLMDFNERKLLRVPDPEHAALQFIHVIAGDIIMRCLLSLEPISSYDKDSSIASGLRLFLSLYQVDG